MPDEPGALWMPTSHCWVGDNHPRFVIVHGTGSSLTETAQNVAQFFQTNSPATSTHYVIGRDGTIVQCVAEADAAWGNGVISAGADAWWTGNPNEVTISIEHVNDSANSTPLSPAQQAASFALIGHICDRHGIPKRPADSAGGITGHYSIDPVNRARCPGNYPWQQLWQFLSGGSMSYVIGTGMQAELAAHPEYGSAASNEVYRGNGDAYVFTTSGMCLEWIKASQTVQPGCDVVAAAIADRDGQIVALQHQVTALQQEVADLQAKLSGSQADPVVVAESAAFRAIKAALATQ